MEKFSDNPFENTAPLILEAELVIKEGFWNNVEFVNCTAAIKVLTFLNSVSYQNRTSLTTNAVGVEILSWVVILWLSSVNGQYRKANNYSIVALILLVVTLLPLFQ
ncbi:MAG: hypothetical protein ACI9GO_000369 [Bacteroidia bacterium]|jgi:hypothetical protein